MTKTNQQLFALATTLAGLVLIAGCASAPGTTAPQDSTKYTLENTENFELLGADTPSALACTGLQPRTLPDGRLEVVATVKNREPRPLKLQINCVFKDAQGFSTGDDTPLETLTLAANATEAVRFTARDPAAKKYTIRARALR